MHLLYQVTIKHINYLCFSHIASASVMFETIVCTSDRSVRASRVYSRVSCWCVGYRGVRGVLGVGVYAAGGGAGCSCVICM